MKISRIQVLFLVLLVGISFTFARQKPKNQLLKPTGDPNATQDLVHKVGKLWNTVSNFGRYGDPDASSTGRPSMEWPGGSRVNYLWEGRFWVGGLVNGEIHVSHADYGNYEFYPTEGTDFILGPGQSIEDHWCTYDDLNPNFHSTSPLGIVINEHGLTWSTPEYDDFIAYEYEVINVGENNIENLYVSWVYDSDVGTVADPTDPHIDDVVDFDGWDGNSSDTDIEDIVENIDLNGNGVLDGYDEYGIPYGWELLGNPDKPQPNYDPSKISPDGFYDEWTVILDDKGPVLRWQTDGPYGKAGEIAVVNGKELHGYLVPRNMSYMYDGDNPSTAADDTGERTESFGPVTGFIGGRLIYTPYRFHDGMDSIMRVSSHQWWNWESDPGTDKEKYEYMTATHPFSKQVFLQRPFELGAPVFDYRWMTTTGPFKSFEPGDTLHFVYVAAVGLGIRGLRENVDNALRAYYSGSTKSNPYHPSAPNEDVHWVLPVPPPQPALNYSPLFEGVQLAWDTKAETAVDPMLNEVDFAGYKIYRALYAPKDWQMIAAFDNIDGPVAVVTTDGDTLAKNVDLPPIQNTFIDTGGVFLGKKFDRPVNGLPYYYAVVAYDKDKPATPNRPALYSIESPKTNFLTDPVTGAPLPIIPKGLYEYKDGKLTPYDIDKVTVVPNPYLGASILEERYQEKIMFQNLPPACKISIFTLTGDLVIELFHNNGTSQELWNILSRNKQAVKTGMYIYVVEDGKGNKKIGKFVIMR